MFGGVAFGWVAPGQANVVGVAPPPFVEPENPLLIAIPRSRSRYIVSCESRSIVETEPAVLTSVQSDSRYLVECQSRSVSDLGTVVLSTLQSASRYLATCQSSSFVAFVNR